MSKTCADHQPSTPFSCRLNKRRRGLLRLTLRAHGGRISRWIVVGFQLALLCVLFAVPSSAQSSSLQQAAGGVVFSGAASPFHTGFGNVNGLGIGTPASGLTKLD